MKKKLLFTILVLLVPSFAIAHVSVTVLEVLPAEGTVTKLSAQSAALGPSGDVVAIEAWLKGYDAAFNAKDLDKLATFYHPDVTIYEGGGINSGWIDYRDRHLGPELKAFENLQFGHGNTKVAMLSGGQSAYVTSEYSIKAKMGEREIDSRGLETLVLVKWADGSWKIRHSHTSSRPARRPAGGQASRRHRVMRSGEAESRLGRAARPLPPEDNVAHARNCLSRGAKSSCSDWAPR